MAQCSNVKDHRLSPAPNNLLYMSTTIPPLARLAGGEVPSVRSTTVELLLLLLSLFLLLPIPAAAPERLPSTLCRGGGRTSAELRTAAVEVPAPTVKMIEGMHWFKTLI